MTSTNWLARNHVIQLQVVQQKALHRLRHRRLWEDRPHHLRCHFRLTTTTITTATTTTTTTTTTTITANRELV